MSFLLRERTYLLYQKIKCEDLTIIHEELGRILKEHILFYVRRLMSQKPELKSCLLALDVKFAGISWDKSLDKLYEFRTKPRRDNKPNSRSVVLVAKIREDFLALLLPLFGFDVNKIPMMHFVSGTTRCGLARIDREKAAWTF